MSLEVVLHVQDALRQTAEARATVRYAGALVFEVPDTIASDGSRDAALDLTAWIASLPNGTPDRPRIIRLRPGARYLLERTSKVPFRDAHLSIVGSEHTVIDCAGATFVVAPVGSYPDNARHILLWNARSTHLMNIGGVVGTNQVLDEEGYPQYQAVREAEHGVELAGCEDCEVDRFIVDGVWGDGWYIGSSRDPQTGAFRPSRRCWIHHFTIAKNGRQGYAFCHCYDVTITNGDVQASRRSGADGEPLAAWTIDAVRIRNVRHRNWLNALSLSGKGVIRNVDVEGLEAVTRSTIQVGKNDQPDRVRQNIRLARVTALEPRGAPNPPVWLFDVDGFELSDSRFVWEPRRATAGVGFNRCRGRLRIYNNAFEHASAVYVADAASDLSDLVESGNRVGPPPTMMTRVGAALSRLLSGRACADCGRAGRDLDRRGICEECALERVRAERRETLLAAGKNPDDWAWAA